MHKQRLFDILNIITHFFGMKYTKIYLKEWLETNNPGELYDLENALNYNEIDVDMTSINAGE